MMNTAPNIAELFQTADFMKEKHVPVIEVPQPSGHPRKLGLQLGFPSGQRRGVIVTRGHGFAHTSRKHCNGCALVVVPWPNDTAAA
jgi:hypothetical protein